MALRSHASPCAPDLTGLKIARIATVPMFFATHLKDQLPAIAAAGAQVDVICSDGPQMSDIIWSDRLRPVLIEIPRSIAPRADLKALWALWRQFRIERYDIIHSTTPKAGLLSALAGWLARVPVRLHTFTGQPWITLHGPKAWVAKASDWLIGRLSTHCFTDSHSQMQFLIEHGILTGDTVDVLGKGSVAGVDTVRFDLARFPADYRATARAELGLATQDIAFLFLGRICKDKGIFELLEALKQLRHGGHTPRMIMAGPIEAAPGDPIPLTPKMLSDAGIIYVGYTTQPEHYIALADCLVLPSYREGFGSVVIEAAAMGIPSVGTDIYGLSDAIVEGETGLLVPPGQVAPLTQALEQMLIYPEQRRAMGHAAQTRARADFATQALSKVIIERYAAYR